MQKENYQISIDAPVSLVYTNMLGLNDISTYEQWTAAFSATSSYEGSWEKGAKIYFLSNDKKVKREGMIARIEENIPNKFVSIAHYGLLSGEEEITEGPELDKWAGAMENYSFEEQNGQTIVKVEIDVTPEYLDFFSETWPKALGKLKEISEKANNKT